MKEPVVPVGVLNLLRRVDADEDQELVYETGAGWWVGCDRVGSRWAKLATQLVLVGLCSTYTPGEGMERWSLNEEGRALLADPTYVPKIVTYLRARRRFP